VPRPEVQDDCGSNENIFLFIGTVQAFMPFQKERKDDLVYWLEVIKLRSPENYERILETIRPLLGSVQDKDLVRIRIYRHIAIETDLSLHLHWESNGPTRKASVLGHQLVQMMKAFGLIDHSLWLEDERQDRERAKK
jgi:hypothetical protein